MLGDLFIEQAFDETVGAEEKNISSFESYGSHLGADKLVPCTEGFLQKVSARVLACLAFVQVTVSVKPTHMGVILSELPQFSFAL